MKTTARLSLLSAGLVAGMLSTAAAVPVYMETVVHDTTTNVEITLDDSTVLCSSADYGALFLKILIPELAYLTLLDHQNTGAGAPCVAAGACEPGRMPDDIIDPTCLEETVAINVQAVRADESDADTQTCSTYLIEKVHVTIRGVDFYHERSAPLGSRPYADCVSTPVAPLQPIDPGEPGRPGKTDAPYAVTPPGEGGGCSTTGGSGAGGLVLVLAALARRRYRR